MFEAIAAQLLIVIIFLMMRSEIPLQLSLKAPELASHMLWTRTRILNSPEEANFKRRLKRGRA
jgi:hypothetical protein